MSDEILQFDRTDPAKKRAIQRELEKSVARLERGAAARKRRLEHDAPFRRALQTIADMPKPVKLVYAELCAEPLPPGICYKVHKEISDGTYSAETLRLCLDVDKLDAGLKDRITEAIRLRERG